MWLDMSFRILIVDDNAMIRRLVRSSIENNLGWQQCVEAENGQSAVELVKKSQPAVVILDLQLPTIDGFETARQILRISPTTLMALFTLEDHEEVVKEAKAIGIQRVFSKSNSLDLLVNWLRVISRQYAVVGL